MTIIVPTDFSAVANNAAHYAAQMITGQYETRLVLFHQYERAGDAAEAGALLDKLREELQTSSIARIETHGEEGSDLIGALERYCRHSDADLVVMGITGKSKLEQRFLGSNTLKMVERNVAPVLVIPPTAQFIKVQHACLLSDFKDVQKSIPQTPIKKVLELFRPHLHVVNVNSEHYVSLSQEYMAERNRMMEIFSEFNTEFYFIGTYDLHETVQQFTQDKNIDMLITIPRNHSFWGSLFRTSNTKRLIYESAIPILAAHE